MRCTYQHKAIKVVCKVLVNVYRIFPMLDIMNLFMFVCDSSVVSSVLTVQILQLTLYDLLISESYSLIFFWILNTRVIPAMSVFDFIIVLSPGVKTSARSLFHLT